MSESSVPCAVCGTLSALETPFPPPGMRLWSRSPGGVPWAGSLWQCAGCGALYHMEFVGYHMWYEVIERLPDELRPLVSAGTAWQEAWALRGHASPRAHAYLRDYLEHARYPWSAAADGIVGDLLAEHARGVAVTPRSLHYLRSLFGNYHGLMSEAAPPERIERVWERCRVLSASTVSGLAITLQRSAGLGVTRRSQGLGSFVLHSSTDKNPSPRSGTGDTGAKSVLLLTRPYPVLPRLAVAAVSHAAEPSELRGQYTNSATYPVESSPVAHATCARSRIKAAALGSAYVSPQSLPPPMRRPVRLTLPTLPTAQRPERLILEVG